MRVPLSKPWILDSDIDAVNEVLRTPYLSLGPKLREFENMLAIASERRFAVAVNSGTSALHLVLMSLGIGEGDEVITTPFSFIASANSILFVGAKPVFVDIENEYYTMNPELIECAITDKTKAILGVDVFGHPADWDRLLTIAQEHGLKTIEDSAEALGSEYKGRKAGSFGDAAVFGFYPNKQVSTGEGGCVVTDNEQIAVLSRSFRNQGRGEDGNWLKHVRLGYNFRISDINCALGISQLRRLDEIVERRRRLAEIYSEKLNDIEEIITPKISHQVTKMSWFVYVIRLASSFSPDKRDEIIRELSVAGVESREYFSAIHLQPFYKEKFGFTEGSFPVTEAVSQRTIALPFYTTITEEEISYVVSKLKEAIYKARMA